jgi:hypothetical protein
MTSETEIEYVSHMAANHAYCGLRFDPGPRYGRPWHTPWYDHTEARTLHFKHPANAPGFAYLARVMVELTDNSGSIPQTGEEERSGIRIMTFGTIEKTSRDEP